MKKYLITLLPIIVGVALAGVWLAYPANVALANTPAPLAKTFDNSPLKQTPAYTFFLGSPILYQFDESDFDLDGCPGGVDIPNISETVSFENHYVAVIIKVNTPEYWKSDGYNPSLWKIIPIAGENDGVKPDPLWATFNLSHDSPAVLGFTVGTISIPGVITGFDGSEVLNMFIPTGTLTKTSPGNTYYQSDGIYPGEHAHYNFQINASHCSPFAGEVEIIPIFYGTPEDYCPAYQSTGDCDTGSVEADDSDGVGLSTVVGEPYILQILGGPWNNGDIDRFDAAISWDRINWTSLASYEGSGCYDPSDIKGTLHFTATGSTFYVRVNDSDGNFGDNTGSLVYSLCRSEPTDEETTCEDQYELSNLVGSYSVDADLQYGAGMPPSSNLIHGYYYMLETTDPGWDDNPHASWEGEVTKDWTGAAGNSWADINDDWSETLCAVDNDPYQRIYFQADMSDDPYGIRANTEDADFTDNTGRLSYDLWRVNYTPPPADCAANFEIHETIETVTINADRELGRLIPTNIEFSPYQFYAIETTNGPWWEVDFPLEAVPRLDLQMTSDGGLHWYELEEHPLVQCVQPTQNGHVRVFFKTAQDGDSFALRVDDNDGDYAPNNDSVDAIIYAVRDLRPRDVDCSEYELGDLMYSYAITASLEAGQEIPAIESHEERILVGNWYALEIAGSQWNDGATATYSAGVALKHYWDTSTGDFYELSEWPGASCVENLGGGKLRAYFKAPDIPIWWRAEDELLYSDNTGFSTYKLYGVDNDPSPPPPCSVNYKPGVLIWEGNIPANLEAGYRIQPGNDVSIQAGIWYRLLTKDGPWLNNNHGLGLYDLEISDDGGNTWVDLSEYPYADCIANIDENHIEVYFIARSDDYRLRVLDDDGEYLPNTGAMGAELYVIGSDPDDPDPGDGSTNPKDPRDYGQGCFATCIPPNSPASPRWTGLADLWEYIVQMTNYLGDWLSNVSSYVGYARCAFSRWIAWCPYHTDVVMALDDLYGGKEPYGTLQEFVDTYEAVRAEVDSYAWVDDADAQTSADIFEGGSTAPDMAPPENFFLAPISETGTSGVQYLPWETDSIWSGDDLEFDSTVNTYQTDCENDMADTMGPILSPGICFGFSALDAAGLNSWYQWLFNLSMLGFMVAYIYKRWFS